MPTAYLNPNCVSDIYSSQSLYVSFSEWPSKMFQWVFFQFKRFVNYSIYLWFLNTGILIFLILITAQILFFLLYKNKSCYFHCFLFFYKNLLKKMENNLELIVTKNKEIWYIFFTNIIFAKYKCIHYNPYIINITNFIIPLSINVL